ncbi:MAG: DUF6249 domain-containing protein [Pseudomonadales bacterium]|nr:DUF6249 domain-containing protein [Pseudomonadales bacterium]
MEEQPNMTFVLAVSTLGIILVAILAWTRRYFGAKRRKEIQKTIRLAFQEGHSPSPDAIRAIAFGEDESRNDLRWGIVLISVAIGLIVFGGVIQYMPEIEGSESMGWLFVGIAAFPGCLGIARLVLHSMESRRRK